MLEQSRRVEEASARAVAELARLLGDHRVSAHPADLHRHATDRSPAALLARRAGLDYPLPLCVARPRTTPQLQELLAWADRTRTPVVPYGGGSGVLGAIAPVGAVVVEMRAMNEVIDFDEKSRLVRAQAGVLGPDLEEALNSWGFTLGHQPQSIEISTVGGWVATRASGQLSARYGGIEALIAGLEAVLPGGRVVRSRPLPRRAAGPDLAALLIGSEGTLGVITEATLRVSPSVGARLNRCIRFEHMADGVAACRAILQGDLKPTLVRLYDREDAAIFLRKLPDEEPDPLMLLSFDGPLAEERASRAMELSGGSEGNHGLVDHWWTHRNDAVDEFKELMAGEGVLGPHAMVDTMEVSGTWTVLRDLYHSMKEALGPLADVVGCHISHVYPDGACLYFTMASACSDDDSALATLESWWESGMETCLRAGGSISHHHGIGRVKARWLRQELGEWWEVLAAVKAAIDPNGIMNPGALGL
jgi:alkyldihydroxyacetonephosphate synthase